MRFFIFLISISLNHFLKIPVSLKEAAQIFFHDLHILFSIHFVVDGQKYKTTKIRKNVFFIKWSSSRQTSPWDMH